MNLAKLVQLCLLGRRTSILLVLFHPGHSAGREIRRREGLVSLKVFQIRGFSDIPWVLQLLIYF